ncbi:MAG: hypothetical protein DLM65_11885, partial [Candidatus Aeolococcus gillhamiae]
MTTATVPAPPSGPPAGIASAATMTVSDALRELGSSAHEGLPVDEVARRQARWGPNAVASHKARLLPVLWHQLRSPL